MKTKTKVINFTKQQIQDKWYWFEQNVLRNNILWLWMWLFISMFFIFISMFFILISAFDTPVQANENKYNNDICDTDKCNARVERLNLCNWDIDCAIKMTQEASYNYLYNEIANLEKESSQTIKTGLDDAALFISDFEWLRLNAYYDWYLNNSNRWSIWYWTKSYKWEVITKQEAIKRKMVVVTPIYEGIPNCFNVNKKIALTSYIYNTWGNQMNLKYYIKECKKEDIRYIMQVYGWNKWLENRRGKELLLFNS